MKRAKLCLLAGAMLLAFSASSRAEGIDGTKPLVCDLSRAVLCDGIAQCERASMDQISLPPVVNVDFESGRLVSEDGTRTSPILTSVVLDAAVLLQGHQNGRGWTMVIERATGHLSATLADIEDAIVIVGACTTR
jgi:hypothetical protein